MTYVAQFLHKYPELRSDTGDTLNAIQTEYNQLIQWLIERNEWLNIARETNSLPMDYISMSDTVYVCIIYILLNVNSYLNHLTYFCLIFYKI